MIRTQFNARSFPTRHGAPRVSIELQRLSYMVNAGLISRAHFSAVWGPTFRKCWNQLEFWVKHKRIKDGEAMELTVVRAP